MSPISSTPLFLFLLLLLSNPSPLFAIPEIRINAGGLAISDYLADPIAYVLGLDKTYAGPKIPGLGVGASHRWGGFEGFSYDLPTGNGVFDVQLIFAEIYPGTMAQGARIFNVLIEDDVVLPQLDVFSEVGENTELIKLVNAVNVTDQKLTISFSQGGNNNPMVSGLVIRRADGGDIPYVQSVTGEGVGQGSQFDDKVYDHQAHAVAGGPYTETDYNNDGEVVLEVDGTNSHSHYNNPETEESGFIVSYSWKVNGAQISNKSKFTALFPVGVTTLELTVIDQTGDEATATTEVNALPATAGGAYCYYYNGITELPGNPNQGPRPDAGHSSDDIDFDDDEFPYQNDNADPDNDENEVWAARCLTDFSSLETKRYALGVEYEGGRVELWVNGVKKAQGQRSARTARVAANITMPMGKVPLQILYFRDGAAGTLRLLVDGVVASPTVLGFQTSTIVPAIASISVSVVSAGGSGQLQIKGTGFFNTPQVKIGDAMPTFTTVSATEIVVGSIPSQEEAGGSSVDVTVTNNAGVSNSLTLQYSDAEDVVNGVAWEETYLMSESRDKFPLKQVTAIAIGPDSFYYVGSVSGFVTKFSAGKNLQVRNLCTGPNMGESRAILGLAFNYKSPVNRVYVTTNTLYFAMGGPLKDTVDGWANGKVESLTSGCGCLCRERTVVSGLPVSNHDHGVNSLEFLPNGDLLIAVGGSTNAGHNTDGNKLGGWPESPLSGAIVVAKLSKDGFDGNVVYDQYRNPETAVQISGDVEVYAPGFRNCFGLTIRTNGDIWATDNGGNFGYGDVSTGCDTVEPFSTKQYDEVNKVERGVYYGHPNRNRGGNECVYGAGGGIARKKMVSSTTGITEYSGNVFGENLKEKLILSKYAASGTGLLWRVDESDGGFNPIQMAGYSALSVITGLHGELIMPRVQQGFVAVMKPVYPVPSGPFVINVSPRRGLAGKRVFVSGENFARGMEIRFGSNAATNVQVADGNGAFCIVPEGSGQVKVVVTVDGVASAATVGIDFIYA